MRRRLLLGVTLVVGCQMDPPPPAPLVEPVSPAQPTETPAPAPKYDSYDPPPGVEERLLAMTSLELFSVDPGRRISCTSASGRTRCAPR